MKIILFAMLIAACMAASFIGNKETGNIDFEMDVHQDSPIGFFVKGSIDPKQDTNNKIQAFLRLANQYIPLLESIANNENSLKYTRDWHVQFAGINLDIHWWLQLIVGWRVVPGSYSANFYEVTYTPFLHGATFGRVNGTTWPAVGSTRLGLQYVNAYAPTAVTLYREGKVCFSSRYVVDPIHLENHVFAALNACEAEIIDEIINQQPIHLGCNYTNPVNFTLFNANLTSSFNGNIIGETCIG